MVCGAALLGRHESEASETSLELPVVRAEQKVGRAFDENLRLTHLPDSIGLHGREGEREGGGKGDRRRIRLRWVSP